MRPNTKRASKLGRWRRICGQPCRILLLHTPHDCATREATGTSKKLQARLKPRSVAVHDDITTALEGAGIEHRRRPDGIDPSRLVDMSRDTNIRFDLFDKATLCSAA